MLKILLIGVAILATGCNSVQNDYDEKCECKERWDGTMECKCKDYDRESIYNDFSDIGIVYDMGDDVIFEDMDSKIVFTNI